MMRNKKLIRILALAGGVFLAGLVYLFLQVREAGDLWPYYKEPGTLLGTITRLEGEVNTLRMKTAQIPAAQEELARIKVEYDLATRVLPRESSPDQLLNAIRLKAQQTGVVPDSLVPSTTGAMRQANNRGKTSFEEWSFSLSIRGSYDQLATFVNRMEEFESGGKDGLGSEKWFFQVRDIEITAQDSGMANLGPQAVGGNVMHQCNLVMQTYRYTGEVIE